MATGAPQITGTGDYVKEPENYQREMPVGEQLGQVIEAAKGKVHEFANQANIKFEQAKNDPSNKPSDEKLKLDMDSTAKDTTTTYNTAVNQVTNVVNSVKGACTSTKNSGTTTATSAPNASDSAPAQPAQSVTNSIGQTAAVITDAVDNTFTPRQTIPGTESEVRTAAKISTALLSGCFAILWFFTMATTVTARLLANVSGSVSSAVQERLLIDEQVACQEIARALNRKPVTIDFSWAQSGFLFAIEIVKIGTGIGTGMGTYYLVDRWRKTKSWWKPYLPRTLEDELKPVMEQLAANANEVVATLNQVVATLNRVATSIEDCGKQSAASANAMVAALKRVATSTEDGGKQFAACANAMADLPAQLAAALNPLATTTADAERKEEETNKTKKVDCVEEGLRGREAHSKTNNLASDIWPVVETEPVQSGEGTSHRGG